MHDGPDQEVADLFDRYLGVFTDASRRFGALFPYNHLRTRIQSLLAGRTARVLVRDHTGAAVASFDVEWSDGQFRRVGPNGEPALCWALDLQTLEDAAATPWTYLAHPRRLGFAWFDADAAAKTPHKPSMA